VLPYYITLNVPIKRRLLSFGSCTDLLLTDIHTHTPALAWRVISTLDGYDRFGEDRVQEEEECLVRSGRALLLACL